MNIHKFSIFCSAVWIDFFILIGILWAFFTDTLVNLNVSTWLFSYIIYTVFSFLVFIIVYNFRERKGRVFQGWQSEIFRGNYVRNWFAFFFAYLVLFFVYRDMLLASDFSTVLYWLGMAVFMITSIIMSELQVQKNKDIAQFEARARSMYINFLAFFWLMVSWTGVEERYLEAGVFMLFCMVLLKISFTVLDYFCVGCKNFEREMMYKASILVIAISTGVGLMSLL